VNKKEIVMNTNTTDKTINPEAESKTPECSAGDDLAEVADDGVGPPQNDRDSVRDMPTSSDARYDANRKNARHSTGPKTPGGKRRSRRNAVRHGLRSRTLLLDGTLEPDAASIIAGLLAEHTPKNLVEHLKLEKLALVILRLRRQARLEREALDHQHAFQAEGTGRLMQFIALTDKQLGVATDEWTAMLRSAESVAEEEVDPDESTG
jgi:hypothetical protein